MPSPTSTPASPVTLPDDNSQGGDEVTYRSEVSAVDQPAELAATGANAWVIGVAALAVVILGTYLVVFGRRRGERCPKCGGPVQPITRTHPVFGDWDGVTCRDCFWTEVR